MSFLLFSPVPPVSTLRFMTAYVTPGPKRVRNELVHINSLSDVEQIIFAALEHPEDSSEEELEASQEAVRDAELDLTCAV